jgi:5-hydroxyisourate hydrolase
MALERRPTISTHVLDTERGTPGVGVRVTLARREGERFVTLRSADTDDDGRVRDLLGAPLEAGGYRLEFDLARYFERSGGDSPFLTRVTIEFDVADVGRSYHVALLASRYACSSYRGS